MKKKCYVVHWSGYLHPSVTQQTQNICITFVQRRPNVEPKEDNYVDSFIFDIESTLFSIIPL